MQITDIYYYYLPVEWREEFRTSEMIEKINSLNDDWNLEFQCEPNEVESHSWITGRCQISVLVSYLKTGPTGCPHCEIERIKSYEDSSDPEEQKQYLQYCQIKNDAPSFWNRFRNHLIKE